MVRVAKRGAKIIIADEVEDIAESSENMPGFGVFYKDRKEVISVPVDLVPSSMQEVAVEYLYSGRLYCLTFRKPF